jgi:hypothetical protein
MGKCDMICVRSFIKIYIGIRGILRFSPAIWISVMLVLPMGRIYDVRHGNYIGWDNTRAKFNDDWFRYFKYNYIYYRNSLRGCNVGITNRIDLWSTPFVIDSYGMIYIPSFSKIGEGVQAILRLCLRNLRNVMLVLVMGNIYELHRWDGLRCLDIYIYRVSQIMFQPLKS